jgi:hypothetical protein
LDVLQKRFCQRPNRSPISSSFDYSAFQYKGFPDKLNLSKHIAFRQPPHLAFPDHVQNLIALNRPPRSITRGKWIPGELADLILRLPDEQTAAPRGFMLDNALRRQRQALFQGQRLWSDSASIVDNFSTSTK